MTLPLDDHPLFRTELAGTTLVEASAGTGKTWTMSGLYARLVLSGHEPRELLAVTYTKAATAELKSRIRQLLVALSARLDDDASPGDDALVEALVARVPDRAVARRRVAAAVASFDEALVTTIHGFCQRALAESAFESALPFEVELVTDESALLAEIAEDFWRVRTERLPRPFAHFLARRGAGPATLVGLARPLLGAAAGMPVPPRVPAFDDAAFEACFDAAARIWLGEADSAIESLKAAASWQAAWVDSAAASIDRWFRHGWPSADLVDVSIDKVPRPALARFAQRIVESHPRKGAKAPNHPFFAAAERLLPFVEACESAFGLRLQALVLDFATEARAKLDARKRESGQQAYDDLLTRLADALEGAGGEALARRLRSRYRAALVDEFQDTDRVQYGIFRRIFDADAIPLVFVGDPKQAIYGFRGADVFAYLEAARGAAKLALATNRRSVPELVRAVNAVFDVSLPFAVDAIGFLPAEPLDAAPGRLDLGAAGAPLVVWWDGRDGKPFSKEDFGARVVEATADEIVRLLAAGRDGTARVTRKGRTGPLGGSHIAVLVRTNGEAAQMRAALASRGVASVTHGQSSVLASAEAGHFGRVLAAVADPLDGALLRAALATPLFGLDAGALVALREDAVAWEAWIETFQRYHGLVHAAGPMRLWREIVREQRVVARLAPRLDGARALTNCRHVAELLHRQALEQDLDPAALAAALSRRRSADDPIADEELVRLESEDDLVRILTIHVSKGLEFPIVFCPFLWNGRLGAEGAATVSFHDPVSGELRVDLGSEHIDEARRIALVEQMGEQLRLAYVALTRAEHRLYLACGTVTGAPDSSLAWLLHRDDPSLAPADAIAALRQKFKARPLATRDDLDRLAARAGGAIDVVALPDAGRSSVPFDTQGPVEAGAAAEVPGIARPFGRGSLHARRVLSFSSLVAGGAAETPDHDAFARRASPEGDAERVTADADDPAFRFPAGAREGSALHAIFEAIDFRTATSVDIERAARRLLPQFGIGETWAGAAARIVGNALAGPLDASGLALRHVDAARRRLELEFAYPVAPGDGRMLLALVAEHRAAAGVPADALAGFEPRLAAGFMKGFVDLVFEHDGRFHIVDYKSNLLGRTLAAYAPGPLAAAIGEEFYDLQYLIYSVALDRLLAWRLPGYEFDRHFGGVFYLFLRGMRPGGAPGQGVFAARPTQDLVRRLGRLLGGAGR